MAVRLFIYPQFGDHFGSEPSPSVRYISCVVWSYSQTIWLTNWSWGSFKTYVKSIQWHALTSWEARVMTATRVKDRQLPRPILLHYGCGRRLFSFRPAVRMRRGAVGETCHFSHVMMWRSFPFVLYILVYTAYTSCWDVFFLMFFTLMIVPPFSTTSRPYVSKPAPH